MAKIPDNAKKVFDGVIFDVYQWEQEMFDDSTDTFEMVKRPYTCEVISILPDNSIAIAHEQQPHMSLPAYGLFSGRMEQGEEPLEAIKRELKEEAGMESTDWELYSSHGHGGKMDWTVYTFIARNCEKVTEPHLENGERINIHTCSFDEFVLKATDPGFRSGEIGEHIYHLRAENRLDELRTKLFPH